MKEGTKYKSYHSTMNIRRITYKYKECSTYGSENRYLLTFSFICFFNWGFGTGRRLFQGPQIGIKNDGIQIFFSVIRRYEIVKTVGFRHQFANDASFGLTIKVIPITHTVRNFYTIFFSRLIVRLNCCATGNDSIREGNVCK